VTNAPGADRSCTAELLADNRKMSAIVERHIRLLSG
jgi:hypothetical protein